MYSTTKTNPQALPVGTPATILYGTRKGVKVVIENLVGEVSPFMYLVRVVGTSLTLLKRGDELT
jgi:hypothetical protein